jgi:hypothetical protein
MESDSMLKLIYKIDSTSNREGGKKEIPAEWKEQEYFIHRAFVGSSARLVFVDELNEHDAMGLSTSTLEEISIWENGIKLTTKNTVYYLKPVVKE